MTNLINITLIAAALAALSLTAVAGDHEKGEQTIEAAKIDGAEAKEMVTDEATSAKEELEAIRTDVDEAEVKEQLEEAQHDADLSKLQEAEAEVTADAIAPE